MSMAKDSESARKTDHLDLAAKSQVLGDLGDSELPLYYEPLLGKFPAKNEYSFPSFPSPFFFEKLKAPLWISSMTGGTESAELINKRLALAAGKFGLGFGLGSCRSLIGKGKKNSNFNDFNVRSEIGESGVLFANLGIAQIAILLEEKREEEVLELMSLLGADGFFIHVNPLQEWIQPEGDHINRPIGESILEFSEFFKRHSKKLLFIKEVGQGFGPQSLKIALGAPCIDGVELAGRGGTNFSRLESLRLQSKAGTQSSRRELEILGHSNVEMCGFIANIATESSAEVKNKSIIFSGGIRSYLDGYALMKKASQFWQGPLLYAKAYPFLEKAKEGQESLNNYIEEELRGLALAREFLYL